MSYSYSTQEIQKKLMFHKSIHSSQNYVFAKPIKKGEYNRGIFLVIVFEVM